VRPRERREPRAVERDFQVVNDTLDAPQLSIRATRILSLGQDQRA
jgi:hypothetical protein